MNTINGYFKKGTHGYMYCSDGNFSEYIYSLIDGIIDDDFKRYDNAFELGAGMGRFSFALIRNFPKVWLVEPSQSYAETLEKLFGNKETTVHNATSKGTVTIVNSTMEEFMKTNNIPEKSIIFCYHLLHHLSYEQRKELFICLVETNAPAVFIEPNPFNPLIILQLMLYRDMRFKNEFQYLTFTKSKLSRELSQCGLKVLMHNRFCFMPPPITRLALKRSFFVKPLLLLEKLKHVLPMLCAYQLFYCKGKK
jgi:hypothetical protein